MLAATALAVAPLETARPRTCGHPRATDAHPFCPWPDCGAGHPDDVIAVASPPDRTGRQRELVLRRERDGIRGWRWAAAGTLFY